MKPLEGIRVLDMGRFVSAPFCGMLLGDMGAEVIKIEKPIRGEDSRGVGPFKNGQSLYVPCFNRNKKGITLQTRSEEGKDLLKQLIATADVLIENFRPGTMAKMGLGYEEVKKINPRIIMASISGYGQTGPDTLKPAFDPIAQAVSGLYSVTGTRDSGPLGAGTVIADLSTGLYTAYSILSAIIQREKTGVGQYIDIAMVDCMVSLLHTYIADYSANGHVMERHGNSDPLSVPADCYRAQNGYVVMHAGESKTFKLLQELIGDERMMDPAYDTHQGRVNARRELDACVQDWMEHKDADEAVKLLSDKGIIAAVVNDIPRLFRSEQIKARQMLVEMEVPGAGVCTFQGSPLKMSNAPVDYVRAPMVGEHNDEILGAFQHMDKEKLNQLRKNGVI